MSRYIVLITERNAEKIGQSRDPNQLVAQIAERFVLAAAGRWIAAAAKPNSRKLQGDTAPRLRRGSLVPGGSREMMTSGSREICEMSDFRKKLVIFKARIVLDDKGAKRLYE